MGSKSVKEKALESKIVDSLHSLFICLMSPWDGRYRYLANKDNLMITIDKKQGKYYLEFSYKKDEKIITYISGAVPMINLTIEISEVIILKPDYIIIFMEGDRKVYR